MESDLKLPEGETPVYSRNRKVTITTDSGSNVEKIERDTVLTTNGESQFVYLNYIPFRILKKHLVPFG